jgi:hypothetical protein
MVLYNDPTFAVGRVPIRDENRMLYALPMLTAKTPIPIPPKEPVELPQWTANGVQWSFYNPASNSFAPTPNFSTGEQLKAQVHASSLDRRPQSTQHEVNRPATSQQPRYNANPKTPTLNVTPYPDAAPTGGN